MKLLYVINENAYWNSIELIAKENVFHRFFIFFLTKLDFSEFVFSISCKVRCFCRLQCGQCLRVPNFP